MKGKLYVCATPIGNLGDITLRALEILRSADLIAAEDTRHTQKLLNHYEIKTSTTSFHEHNQAEKAPLLVEELLAGKNVALVTDAGTPAISDPGEELVRRAVNAGVEVVPVPGPAALIAALVVSGLPTGRFHFEGFVPRKKRERLAFWRERKSLTGTTVFYEAPHRLLASLTDMLEVLGDRRVAVCREITKQYEETFRGTTSEAIEHFGRGKVRGEFVIVVEGDTGTSGPVRETSLDPDQGEIVREVKRLMEEGLSKKEAIKHLAKETGLNRKVIYQAATAITDISGNR